MSEIIDDAILSKSGYADGSSSFAGRKRATVVVSG